ncbi:MAG: hypothetical protein JST64_05655, partial [Actinobacteria bacterium]|nr:hypothetical protein [Actinomycetota bacterium]
MDAASTRDERSDTRASTGAPSPPVWDPGDQGDVAEVDDADDVPGDRPDLTAPSTGTSSTAHRVDPPIPPIGEPNVGSAGVVRPGRPVSRSVIGFSVAASAVVVL